MLAVRLGEEEVPPGIEGVHLELEVVQGIARGVEEDFEVVVAEDDGIVFFEGAPDVWLFEVGGDVDDIERAIAARDNSDSSRADSPLREADGSIVLDTSGLSIEAVLSTIEGLLNNPE